MNTPAAMHKLYYGFKVAAEVGLNERESIQFVEFFMRFKPTDLEYRYHYVTEVAQRFKNKSYAHYFDENCTAIWNGMMQEGF